MDHARMHKIPATEVAGIQKLLDLDSNQEPTELREEQKSYVIPAFHWQLLRKYSYLNVI
jgi:hypothetical protein